MRKLKAPNNRYLLFRNNGYEGVGGLTDILLGFDSFAEVLKELATIEATNPDMLTRVSFEILDMETRDIYTFATFFVLEHFLKGEPQG